MCLSLVYLIYQDPYPRSATQTQSPRLINQLSLGNLNLASPAIIHSMFKSRYFCECQRKRNIHEKGEIQRELADLFFCMGCQTLKCDQCCLIRTAGKFCAGCQTDYSGNAGVTRCTRNCFSCPECLSVLEIESKEVKGSAHNGKIFHFKCVHCDYEYETEAVFKPAPLVNILRKQAGGRRQMFATAMKKYQAVAELQDPRVKSKDQDPRVSHHTQDPKSRERARQMQITPPPDHQATLQAAANTEPIQLTSEKPRKQPVLAKLYGKYTWSCDVCARELFRPAGRLKVVTKAYAVETVPEVRAVALGGAELLANSGNSDDIDVPCRLSISNPHPNAASIRVSIVEHVPPHLSGGANVAVSMPQTSVTVSGKTDCALAQTVPTCFLTGNTKQARAERLLRAGSIKEDDIDSGANWATLPFTLTVERGSHVAGVRVPFHLQVSVPNTSTSKITDGKSSQLQFAFWCVCEV